MVNGLPHPVLAIKVFDYPSSLLIRTNKYDSDVSQLPRRTFPADPLRQGIFMTLVFAEGELVVQSRRPLPPTCR
jgi:hypothetical protein